MEVKKSPKADLEKGKTMGDRRTCSTVRGLRMERP